MAIKIISRLVICVLLAQFSIAVETINTGNNHAGAASFDTIKGEAVSCSFDRGINLYGYPVKIKLFIVEPYLNIVSSFVRCRVCLSEPAVATIQIIKYPPWSKGTFI